MSLTLFLYLVRRFLGTLLAAVIVVLALIVLIDLVELMRRTANSDATVWDLLGLALLHALPVAGTTFPFVMMLSSMACFTRLARSSELVVARASGLSGWRILMPAVLSAAILGVVGFAVLNPLSAAMLQRYETLEARFLRGQESLLSISREGLWLRQADTFGQTVIRAEHANSAGTRLYGVSLFEFGRDNQLLGRIEAEEAELLPGEWRLHDVMRWNFDPANPNTPPKRVREDSRSVATDLTSDRILESFASPDAIGFWDLPEFIETLRASGFSALRHQMHFDRELTKPLLFSAMVLLGAAFSMGSARLSRIGLMLLAATLTGFALFFISDITQALGASGAIPTLLAAWVPPSAAALLALGLLFYMEDG
ncbi:MAG: LPS export ABC transporter permease LptG [Alphaproteobacteria bacterium]|nr:MAG: LPS export ABC transporter permease LptG [Alphaproteobacteria bacterium]